MTDEVVSAVPKALDDYSNATMHAGGLIGGWVRGEFAAQVQAYRKGAVDYGAGLVGDIESRVSDLLAKMWTTDHRVGEVGRLFLEAGAGQRPVWMLPDPAKVVVTTDARLDQIDQQDGRTLAQKLNFDQGSTDAKVLAELAQHSDDPMFCAGFFNAIPQDRIWWLPNQRSVDRALTSAFASGALTKDAMHRILLSMEYLGGYSHDGQLQDLYRALATNPQASANFARYLSQHPGDLNRLLSGLSEALHTTGGSRSQEVGQIKGFLAVLTAALPNMTSADIGTLLNGMGQGGLPISFKTWQDIRGGLQSFVTAAVTHMLPTLSAHPTQTELENFAITYGGSLRNLINLENAVTGVYAGHSASMQDEHNLIENTVIGVLTAIPTLGSDLPSWLALTIAGGSGGAGGEAQTQLDKFLQDHGLWTVPSATNGPKNFDGVAHYGAVLTLTTLLYQRGLVTANGKPVTYQQLTNDPNYKALLQAAGSDSVQTLDSKWLQSQVVHTPGGGQTDLYTIISQAFLKFPEYR